jgi:sugar-specific transcriptional regulator TrmB
MSGPVTLAERFRWYEDRIAELERERDVWRRLAGELRIEELERELEECKHDIERHIAIVEELERERDEARGMCEQMLDALLRTPAAVGERQVSESNSFEEWLDGEPEETVSGREVWTAMSARIAKLERERDEARKVARMYRTVAAMDNPPELPWEEGE